MNKPALTAKAVFDHAHEISSLTERKAYLDQACANAPELRQKVEALLQAHEEAGSFLEKPAFPVHATAPYQPGDDTPGEDSGIHPVTVDYQPHTDRPLPVEGPGTQIGPYKLVRKLGQGGMGAVYLAEQEKPIRRQVALKIIKPGMDSDQVVARFEAERQALSMMDHVNIARVYEAGATERGRPYFVMELVQGIPIRRFCNENTLTIRERLVLFVAVCQAIQHAHQKGIIHRDIKPSNVLVARQDGKPVLKVIDFGLAKATEQPLTDQSLLTQMGTVVGTLEYMSPEQADPGSQGIDTRTDIYSLGVMLYELLTGTTPLDAARLRGAGFLEALRRVREEDPPKPSARLSSLGEKLPAIAAERRTEPARLATLLRGELDWIVMKALEKDRNRRYETSSEFAKDVQRYLEDEPVEACPPSARYRLGKFARKHRTLLATTGGFMAMLVLGVVGLIVGIVQVNEARVKKDDALKKESAARITADNAKQQAVKAEKATRAALDVSDAMIQVVGRRNQTNLGDNEKTILRNLLHEYRRSIPEPGGTPEGRAEVAEKHLRLANKYAFIGERDDAKTSYRTAIQLYQGLVDDFPQVAGYRHNLARCNFDLAILLNIQKQRAEAIAAYQRAIELHERLAKEFPDEAVYRRDLADELNNLGTVLRDERELAKAEMAYTLAIALGERLVLEFPGYQLNLAMNYHNLGNAVRDQGNAKTALAWYGKAIDLLAALQPPSADATLILRNAFWDRANALGQLGQHAEASQDWQRAIALDAGDARPHLRLFLAASQMEEKLKAENDPAAPLLYQAARIHALATAAAEAELEANLQKQYAARSLELLKQARAAGWFSSPQRIKQMKDDKAFAALPPADFKPFLQSLEAEKGAKDRSEKK
jgi:eukaryotic-like serine/threonine-protein kinase